MSFIIEGVNIFFTKDKEWGIIDQVSCIEGGTKRAERDKRKGVVSKKMYQKCIT
jgi:hypothetical protein